MREVVVVSAGRTAIGAYGGSLKGFKAVDLGAMAIKEAVSRAGISPEQVEYVYMGQVVPAGCGQVPGRQASLKAGIPQEVPAVTVNKVCSSGIKTIDMAYQAVQAGRVDIAVAGGMESMTNVPFALPDMRWGARMGTPSKKALDLMVWDGLWCATHNKHMAVLGSDTCKEFGIPREDQDKWATRSQNKAEEGIDAGRLKDEIFPVEIKGRKGAVNVFDTDEQIRRGCTYEALAKLPPVFDPEGTVTAGNAPSINDGAAAVVVMSKEKAEELGIKPLWSILGYAEVSQEPKYIATVPGLSIKKVLEQTGYSLDQMDLIEINEAFAAVALVSGKGILGMSYEQMDEKVNVNGGAVAYGHPIGASGARIAMTLAYELKRRGGGIGVTGICSGQAQGDAMLIKVEA
ncbi:3-ketoacyl-CoA thiolase [isoleucine degradation] [Candidatus Syntrophocurvum alkaliphilum]|uniref:acetyl-CoA C-acetyltransferase n=1 Tax=Candidatus Syntrophocurvum alkaliphilum TaxID=2293317 RepID=A0A6I6D5Q3_9FIRM|nr:acetyl-CoA C-acetyltransferase [Candidatus Syntrophocurvum alkaliphilum]QGT98663.1 3-ketoacyl-CoA thiolase [isoleucine degradation] [Candidatus Syntrophocurvum alkaliphilum]